MNYNRSVSKMVLVISAIIALMEIMVCIMLVLSPTSVAEHVDLNARGVKYLVYMWAARQFALGVIFAYATFRRSPSMLLISYLFFLVMMLGDVITGIVLHQYGMAVAAAVMAIIAISIMISLRKRKNRFEHGLPATKSN